MSYRKHCPSAKSVTTQRSRNNNPSLFHPHDRLSQTINHEEIQVSLWKHWDSLQSPENVKINPRFPDLSVDFPTTCSHNSVMGRRKTYDGVIERVTEPAFSKKYNWWSFSVKHDGKWNSVTSRDKKSAQDLRSSDQSKRVGES